MATLIAVAAPHRQQICTVLTITSSTGRTAQRCSVILLCYGTVNKIHIFSCSSKGVSTLLQLDVASNRGGAEAHLNNKNTVLSLPWPV